MGDVSFKSQASAWRTIFELCVGLGFSFTNYADSTGVEAISTFIRDLHARATANDKPVKPELKPCPFCGSKDCELSHEAESDRVYVRCYRCGALGGKECNINSAVYSWNLRA